MFLLVIATGSRSSALLHCSTDDFSKVNETRIKVLSSHRADTLKFDVPVEKKHISGKKHCFDAVAKAIYK